SHAQYAGHWRVPHPGPDHLVHHHEPDTAPDHTAARQVHVPCEPGVAGVLDDGRPGQRTPVREVLRDGGSEDPDSGGRRSGLHYHGEDGVRDQWRNERHDSMGLGPYQWHARRDGRMAGVGLLPGPVAPSHPTRMMAPLRWGAVIVRLSCSTDVCMQYRATMGATGVGWSMDRPHRRPRHRRGTDYNGAGQPPARQRGPRPGLQDRRDEEPGTPGRTRPQPPIADREPQAAPAPCPSEGPSVKDWLLMVIHALLPFTDPSRSAWRDDMTRQYEASRKRNLAEQAYLSRRGTP